MSYYDVSEDEVRMIREQARMLESTGTSKFGLSFMTNKIQSSLR